MTNYQKNRLTMYQTVLRFFREEGAPLAAIKLIGEAAAALEAIAGRIGDAQDQQDQPTTGVTGTRKQTKASAAQKAEVLRQLVRALTPDATLRASLDSPVAEMLLGKDDDFIRYLRRISSAVSTLHAQLLTDAGYDPQVRQDLETQRQALTDTQGEARQLETVTSTATDQLPALFAEAITLLENRLDPLVGAQKLARPELVSQYDKARRIVKTAATHGPEYRGQAHYDKPVLVYDRREATLAAPTLGNRSGKGLTLRYYTAHTSTAAPAPGQGVVVKHKTDQHLPDYSKLGPEDAPYLLVRLEQVDGVGKWVVR